MSEVVTKPINLQKNANSSKRSKLRGFSLRSRPGYIFWYYSPLCLYGVTNLFLLTVINPYFLLWQFVFGFRGDLSLAFCHIRKSTSSLWVIIKIIWTWSKITYYLISFRSISLLFTKVRQMLVIKWPTWKDSLKTKQSLKYREKYPQHFLKTVCLWIPYGW